MKRNVLTVVLVLVAVSVFAQSGVIKEMTGTVEVKGAGAAAFAPAKAGEQVKEDTVISTSFKSTALIEIGSTVIAVRPLTRLTLKEIKASQGSETLNVNLQSGRIRVDVNPPAGAKASMSVVSPSATASVRGTSFEFDTRNLHVNIGNVIFKGVRSQGTLITAGFNSTTDLNGIAVNPLDFGMDAFKPQAPVGTQASASPASTPVSFNPDNGNTGGGVNWN
jgi:ribosomal protein L7/L12